MLSPRSTGYIEYIEAHTSPRFSFLWPVLLFLSTSLLRFSRGERMTKTARWKARRRTFRFGCGLQAPMTSDRHPGGSWGSDLSLWFVQEYIKEWTQRREKEWEILKYRMEYVNGWREGFFDSRWDHRVLSGDIYMAPWILSSRIPSDVNLFRGPLFKLYIINSCVRIRE